MNFIRDFLDNIKKTFSGLAGRKNISLKQQLINDFCPEYNEQRKQKNQEIINVLTDNFYVKDFPLGLHVKNGNKGGVEWLKEEYEKLDKTLRPAVTEILLDYKQKLIQFWKDAGKEGNIENDKRNDNFIKVTVLAYDAKKQLMNLRQNIIDGYKQKDEYKNLDDEKLLKNIIKDTGFSQTRMERMIGFTSKLAATKLFDYRSHQWGAVGDSFAMPRDAFEKRDYYEKQLQELSINSDLDYFTGQISKLLNTGLGNISEQIEKAVPETKIILAEIGNTYVRNAYQELIKRGMEADRAMEIISGVIKNAGNNNNADSFLSLTYETLKRENQQYKNR